MTHELETSNFGFITIHCGSEKKLIKVAKKLISGKKILKLCLLACLLVCFVCVGVTWVGLQKKNCCKLVLMFSRVVASAARTILQFCCRILFFWESLVVLNASLVCFVLEKSSYFFNASLIVF